jgi:hypothetical protein
LQAEQVKTHVAHYDMAHEAFKDEAFKDEALMDFDRRVIPNVEGLITAFNAATGPPCALAFDTGH